VGFIEAVKRFHKNRQTTNLYRVIWKPGQQHARRKGPSGGGGSILPTEKNPLCTYGTDKTDLDCPTTNRKDRDSSPVGSLPKSKCQQFHKVREMLAQYMTYQDGPKEYPTDRQVVDIMEAAGTSDEREVIESLKHLYNVRGLRPGTRNGPRSFAWFKTVHQDLASKRTEREEAANPTGYDAWEGRNDSAEARRYAGLSKIEFDKMTDAIEIPQ